MLQNQIFMVSLIHIWISTATEILYILPDNSTNVSCPSQPCATLSQYLLDNGTLPFVSNVEYHFLPGEHHVPANMVLQNLHNFSIIGTVSKPSSPVVLVGCSQLYVLKIINSFNVTITNVIFKQSYQVRLNKYQILTSLLIDLCYSCTIENVTFMNLGLKGTNLIGSSHLTNIVIELKPSFLMFCQGITLNYWDQQQFTNHKHFLVMNHINISGEGTSSKCYYNEGILCILISVMENLIITINNSLFYNLHHTAISINNRCHGNNMVNIENCTFESNAHTYLTDKYNLQTSLRPLIDIVLSHCNKSISFKQCSFKKNYNDNHLISVLVRANKACYGKMKYCVGPFTNITFVRCQFTNNIGELMNVYNAKRCKANLFIIGPSHFAQTVMHFHGHDNIMTISIINVHMIGPVILSSNHATSIMKFESCNVLFHKKIIFKSNNCDQVIYLSLTFIKLMENTNVTLLKNRYLDKLINTKNDYAHELYTFCIFQFVALRNITTVSPLHYSINVIENVYYERCSFPFYYFTPHCKWIPTATFHNYNPWFIYQQVIKIHDQSITFHKICHCSPNGTKNCNIDTLGPVYPGQILQVELCIPCYDKPSILYAEVNNVQVPRSACKVASQTEKINTISNYSRQVTFTIVSEATYTCELFLTASSHSHSINEVFYIQLLPCPIGFRLQNGVCDCDPILSSYTDKCYIDHSAIRRPANTWITAHTQANNTKYLISDCPMDYCLSYSSNINLLHPHLQCQFNRTGILCSQCQHTLSMVFGSSRCVECNNLHVLITIIVIVAGIVLVVLLYLLNFTVTNGTIDGMIFYANIISINDSVFLINDNIFKPLRVFISLVNLDLGIETCFYNGMDDYAKMWLKLFFPFYLIIIAVSIIIVSRYSSKILRLTYTRSLPVLATLFLLSYTGVLRTALTALFSYSTITHLPSGHQQIVWSIDASVPLFGLKFTIIFITCLVLFLLLIPFKIILLFTRYLLWFRLINRFKPLLDAFQGSYKEKYYYWVAVHITMRSFFFAMYAFQTKLKLILSTMLLIIFSIYNGYILPHKNKLVNIQELLLLINLTIMYTISHQGSDIIFSIVTNVMISLAFIQFCIIVIYHFLTYTCHYNVAAKLQISKHKLISLWYKTHLQHTSINFDVELLNIPECTHNYSEYQDGLVTDDFN